MSAIKGMASKAPALKDERKPLVPDVDVAREVSVAIATKVIEQAKKQGLCREENVPDNDGELSQWIEGQMWVPEYPKYEKVEASIDSGSVEV